LRRVLEALRLALSPRATQSRQRLDLQLRRVLEALRLALRGVQVLQLLHHVLHVLQLQHHILLQRVRVLHLLQVLIALLALLHRLHLNCRLARQEERHRGMATEWAPLVLEPLPLDLRPRQQHTLQQPLSLRLPSYVVRRG
jgi:hypothetical protein